MDFLAIREEYKLAFHRWRNFQDRLKEQLGVATDWELEEQLLHIRDGHKLWPMATEYSRLTLAFDQASDRWDTAQMWQARRTAACIAQLDRDVKAIDC